MVRYRVREPDTHLYESYSGNLVSYQGAMDEISDRDKKIKTLEHEAVLLKLECATKHSRIVNLTDQYAALYRECTELARENKKYKEALRKICEKYDFYDRFSLLRNTYTEEMKDIAKEALEG